MGSHVQRIAFFVLMGLLLSGHAAFAQSKRDKKVGPVLHAAAGECDTASWKLVFHDEFDSTSLDRSKWVTYFTYSADGSDQCEGCRVTGSSNAIYRDEQVRVSGGQLTLGVKARPGTWYGQTKEHESGMVHSIGAARFTHGRFEARCRIPAAAGLWPAFWGFGGETEIDVFEFCGERPKWMKASLHRWAKTRFSNTGKHKAMDLSRDLHTYAVEWEDEEVRWYLDGRQVYTRSRFVDRRGRPVPACARRAGEYHTAPYFPRNNDALNVILNLSVSPPKDYCKGPRKPGPWPDGTALVVDHVRIFQRTPQAGLGDLCATPRALRAEQDGPLVSGGTRHLTISGPHGDMIWSAAEGLTIVAQDAGSITVQATGNTQARAWVRAECQDDPCTAGPLLLETFLDVR